jgi:hypothetical protein
MPLQAAGGLDAVLNQWIRAPKPTSGGAGGSSAALGKLMSKLSKGSTSGPPRDPNAAVINPCIMVLTRNVRACQACSPTTRHSRCRHCR